MFVNPNVKILDLNNEFGSYKVLRLFVMVDQKGVT